MYENITYESILQRMLDRIPDDMDKREGAVIYDALAPAAVELQLMYIELDTILRDTFASTTTDRDCMVLRAAERNHSGRCFSSAGKRNNDTGQRECACWKPLFLWFAELYCD
ncbi:MAG: hypothetical protein V8S38_12290 [Lachnospiraceae bacterium]